MGNLIGILLFDDVEELDFVGPWEVFASAAAGRDDDRVVTIAESTAPVRCAKGLRVLPDHAFDDAPALDVLLVPGGQGTRREVDNPVLIDWIRAVVPGCSWVTSVCTGALLLHEAGAARGRRVTTPPRERGPSGLATKVAKLTPTIRGRAGGAGSTCARARVRCRDAFCGSTRATLVRGLRGSPVAG